MLITVDLTHNVIDMHLRALAITIIHSADIVSEIKTTNNGMRLKKSFRLWNKKGVKMLSLKVGQEMLEPCQVSGPITIIQSVIKTWYEHVP